MPGPQLKRRWARWKGVGRRSLLTRLAVFAIFMILLSIAARTAILLPPLRAALIDLSGRHHHAVADQAAAGIGAGVVMRLEVFARLSAALSSAGLNRPEQMEAWLKGRGEIAVLFPEGLTVAAPGSAEGIPDRPTPVAAPQAASAPAVHLSRDARTGSLPVLALTAPVFDRLGVPVATLKGRAAIAAPGLVDPPPGGGDGDMGALQLVSPEDGLVFAFTGGGAVRAVTPLPQAGKDPLLDRAMAGFRGTDTAPDEESGDMVSAVIGVPGTGWFLITRTPMAAALAVFQDVRTIVVIATPAIAVTMVLITVLVIRSFLRPLVESSRAIHRMAEGEIGLHPLRVVRQDEVGDLAKGFNVLLARLAEMTEQKVAAERLRAVEKERMETLLRQWMADTSHELRTPIAVLRGQIEALQDGIFAVDARRLALLHGEVMGMSRLVEELFTLARSDIGQLESRCYPVAILGLLDEVVGVFRDRYAVAGLAIDGPHSTNEGAAEKGAADEGPLVEGDAARLRQVFSNLLENSLRYTDPGGRLRIGCSVEEGQLTLRFDDTGPGVPDEALPRLFERFFRVDVSRSRALGGTGIGLALCHSLVEAHGGTVTAAHSPLGGLRIAIHLPCLKGHAMIEETA